jgi:class 3 adenylate cyclase
VPYEERGAMNPMTLCTHGFGDGACPWCETGATMPLGCASCTEQFPPDSRFCPSCGTPVAITERKPVTVLFVSAHGSPELGVALDAERWHAIIDRFLRILGDGIRSHGGVVDRFTGEGIKAHFGAPVALENHAILACLAALHLAREITVFAEEIRCSDRIAFRVRMGLHSGDVVYGPIGSTLSAQGRTAGIAARIEQSASPGSIHLSEATAQLLDARFELRELGPVELRGVREPLRILELRGARERTRRRPAVHGALPFVGRTVELVMLEALLQRETPSIVAVTGEAGIGKTRLLEELALRAQASGTAISLRLAAVEGERDAPFTFYRRALRRLLEVEPSEPLERARERVAAKFLLSEPGIEAELPRIFELLGLVAPGATPRLHLDGLHLELAALSRRVVDTRDRTRKRLVILDDIQWIDPASLSVMATGVESGVIRPSLLIAVQRGGHDLPFSRLGSFAGSIHLLPLRERESEELLRALLGTDPSLGALRERLRDSSGGNPLFLGELVQSLRTRGALAGEPGALRLVREHAAEDLPPTLHALLAARIDALGREDKTVLQAAAVVGSRFEAAVLARAAARPAIRIAESLRRLQASEIVEAIPADGPGVFGFRHRLLRETALRSMLSGARSRLHVAVAKALAARPHPERDAAEIAGHWREVGAADEAARWLHRAARYAMPRAPSRSLEHLREARALCAECDVSRRDDRLLLDVCVDQLRLGWRHGLPPDEAAEVHADGRRIALELGDASAASSLAAGHAAVVAMSGRTQEVVDLVEVSRALDDGLGHRAPELALRTMRATALFSIGDLAGVLRECSEPLRPQDESLAADPSAGSTPVDYLVLRGTALVDTGALREGGACLEEAIRRARRSGSAITICTAIAAATLRARLTGASPSDLLALCIEGVAIAERAGNDFLLSRMLGALAEVRLMFGQHAAATDLFERAIAIVDASRVLVSDDFGLRTRLAGCRLVAGDPAGALADADRALDAIEGRGGRLREIEINMRWAWVHAAVGRTDPEAVATRVRRCLELVAETGAWSREPFLRLALAWVHRRQGREAEAILETRLALDRLFAMEHWDAQRVALIEGLREATPREQRRGLLRFLSGFGISARNGLPLLP